MSQYDKDEATVLVDGVRVEQMKNFDPPEESYEREFDETVGDDDDVLLSDNNPELEGEIEVSPTSGTIPTLNSLTESGDETTITVRFPSADARDSETYVRAVFTNKAYANSFDDDNTSPPNRTYTWIANDTQ